MTGKEEEGVSGKEKTQDAGKIGLKGAQKVWIPKHGWKGEQTLLAKRGLGG